MNLVLVNIFKVAVVCCQQFGVGDVFANDLGDYLCDPYLEFNCYEAEDVLSVGFVLGVAIGCNFWFNGDGFGADDICDLP